MLTREQITANIEAMEKQGAKQPEIQEWINTLKTETPQEQPKEKGFFRQLGEAIIKPVAEVGVGLYNIGSIAKGQGSPERNLPILGKTKPFMTGQETFGQGVKKMVGYGADIGSNIVGGFGVKQLAKAGWKGTLKKGLSSGIKTGAATGALVGGGKSLEETKSALNILGDTALGALGGGLLGGAIGGAGAVAGKAVKSVLQPGGVIQKIGRTVRKAGEGIQGIVIKPVKKDFDAGFKIENVSKYDLGGNLGDSFEKVHNILKEKKSELDEIVKKISPSKRYKFDIKTYIDELENKYSKGGIGQLGQGRQKMTELENMKKDLAFSLGDDWERRLLGFDDILAIKRQAGLNSAFRHDPLKPQATPDEQVWTDFYMTLKNRLEKEAPKEFAEVNKVMSEIIPIEQAIVRRIPIAERSNVLNIGDLMSLVGATYNPAALSVGIANRLLKSGSVANILMGAGKKIEGVGKKVLPYDKVVKSIPKLFTPEKKQ